MTNIVALKGSDIQELGKEHCYSRDDKLNKIFNISKKPKWTPSEDEILISKVNSTGRNNWKTISSFIKRKSPEMCYERYRQIKPFVKKGRWMKEEDEIILKFISKYGPKWSKIAKFLGNRTGKQIRERFVNRLDCKVIKSPYSLKEDLMILKLQKKYGNDWRLISSYLSGRSPDNIKIRYNSVIKHNKKIFLFLERRDLGVSESEQKAYL
jgi:transcriptional activator Myb